MENEERMTLLASPTDAVLADEEKKRGFITYATLAQYVGDAVLANEYATKRMEHMVCITDNDYTYDEENDSYDYAEIFQYYIISGSSADFLQEYAPEEIIYYDEEMDIYLWGITHFGTAWSGVYTDIPVTGGKSV